MTPRLSYAAAALLAFAAMSNTSARAAITYTATPAGAGDPGQPGGTVIDNFDGIDRAPQTSYFLNSGTQTCTAITSDTTSCNSSIGNPPLIAGQPDTARPVGASGNFLQVNTTSSTGGGFIGFFQLNLASLNTNNVSFLWGSVDQWNFAQLLDASGKALFTVQGTDLGATFNNGIPFSPGDYRLTFNWTSSDPVAILQFGDTFGPAMEVDNVTSVLPASTVPEPASMALLAAGLGAMGVRFGRRRAN